jgi:stage V sporulation protein G
MRITDIRIRKCDDPKLKAYVTLTVDGWLVVRGLKLILGNKGLFVAMPSRRKPDGTFLDIVHPIDAVSRTVMEHAVYIAYRDSLMPPNQAGVPAVPPEGFPPMQRGATREFPPKDSGPTGAGFG